MATSLGSERFSHRSGEENEGGMLLVPECNNTNDDEIRTRFETTHDDEEHQRSHGGLVRQDSGMNQAFAHINILQADIGDFHPHETLIHEEINPFAVQYIETEPRNEVPKVEVQSQNYEIDLKDAIEIVNVESQNRCNKTLGKASEFIRYTYSACLVVFCVVLVNAGILKKQTKLDMHPAGSFILFWFLILWLAMMEGGQGCLVGLQPVEKSKYAKSHPISLQNTLLSHKGDNMERFIVGRQFLVVLVVFLINMIGTPRVGADPLNLSSSVNSVFLDNGVALMITSIVLGNLTSQVNAATCMIDFINNYFMLFTTYVSIGIEFSGLLHSVYLFQYGFAALTKTDVVSKEPPRTKSSELFFWIRVLVSSVLLCFSLAVTLEALFKGQSNIWEGTPEWASVIVFLVFLCIVGIMEGMQIAAFALLNFPEEELKKHGVASANCMLMFEGSNLQSFLIGRQIFVASLMFIVAKIASISVESSESNIFGVPDGFQTFLNTGLLGALVLTIMGSLAWRIIASAYPLAFMSNPLIYVIIRACLFLDLIGLCSCVWPLAKVIRIVFKYKPDTVYLEMKESNDTKEMKEIDKDTDCSGHLEVEIVDEQNGALGYWKQLVKKFGCL